MISPTPYQDPFALLGIDPAAEPDRAGLRQARKRFLAEWELQDPATRQDKTALLTLFEQLDSDVGFLHHRFLHGFESLRRFFENGDAAFFSAENQEAFSSDKRNTPEFREFLAPYFAFHYNQALFAAFRSRDWDRLELLAGVRLPLSAENYPVCYRDLARHLQLRIEAAEELARETDQGQSPGAAVQELCDEWLITAWNYLPAYFEGLRNRYGQALEALALAVQNQHGRSSLAKYIVRQGLKLRLSEETRGRLQHLLDQLLGIEPDGGMEDFTENARQSFRKTFKKVKGWQIALGVVVGVKLLILLLRAVF